MKIGIDEMANVNGSAPDLSKSRKWYINDPASKGPTVYFGDIWLEGGDAPAAAAPGVGTARRRWSATGSRGRSATRTST